MFKKYLKLAMTVLSLNIRENLRNDVLTVGYKLMTGGVFAAVATFSMFQMGGAVQRWLAPMDNGVVVELFVFSLIAAACMFGLGRVMKASMPKPQPAKPEVNRLAAGFIEGFKDGRRRIR